MYLIRFLSICILMFLSNSVYADQNPEAMWRAYDLQGHARSVLKFYIQNGELRADVIKILQKNGDYCVHCKGHLKNKPYLGMTIIRGLKFKNNEWVDGKVLDTDTGNSYSCAISFSKDGNTMHLHAYKGIPLFGRTVDWRREN